MAHYIIRAILFLELLNSFMISHGIEHNPPDFSAKISKFFQGKAGPIDNSHKIEGTIWALLVAGSNGYENYRHQADVCHAFQILKKGGLKEENIIVFMYDDIAFDENNPRPGVIINNPGGEDVYKGVPKDYTGENANVQNLFAVLLGNKSALTGGSGKVLNSGPKDHIFIFYADHGSPGSVGMMDEVIFANDLIKVLKKKHKAKSYESMVFYLEACESGSMFDGLLPENLNIYAITASNPTEDSWATYCPSEDPNIDQEYDVCLGDMFSVSWIEDSEKHDSRSETLEEQLKVVRKRTATENPEGSSHVMQYGSAELSSEFLNAYMGTTKLINGNNNHSWSKHSAAISQRDADLLHYHYKMNKAPKGSSRRIEAQKQLFNEINNRMLVDKKIEKISTFLYGAERGVAMLKTVRPGGKPLVDDWDCLKTFVKTYGKHCGSLTSYGMKHTRTIANMCNEETTVKHMDLAAKRICK